MYNQPKDVVNELKSAQKRAKLLPEMVVLDVLLSLGESRTRDQIFRLVNSTFKDSDYSRPEINAAVDNLKKAGIAFEDSYTGDDEWPEEWRVRQMPRIEPAKLF